MDGERIEGVQLASLRALALSDANRITIDRAAAVSRLAECVEWSEERFQVVASVLYAMIELDASGVQDREALDY